MIKLSVKSKLLIHVVITSET